MRRYKIDYSILIRPGELYGIIILPLFVLSPTTDSMPVGDNASGGEKKLLKLSVKKRVESIYETL